MILYDYILSPDCYKVRLLASLVGARLDLRAVDFHPGGEHRTAPSCGSTRQAPSRCCKTAI